MTILQKQAPNFTLLDEEGKEHTLSDYKGKFILVYFYPKDDTPGCTKEACTIRDVFGDFADLNIVVFGISNDSVESHEKFKEKYHLPFTLLSDPNKEVIELWNAKGPLGLTKRISYLVDPDGIVVKNYPNVSPATHAQEVLDDVKVLTKSMLH